MRGALLRDRRRAAWTLLAALATSAVLAVVPTTPALAETATVPGTMSTDAQNTSQFAVPVPAGTVPSAITAVLTMPEVVDGGTVTFTVNGRVALQVPSTLYRRVTVPVTAADVIADGTIGLGIYTSGPAAAGATCLPAGGSASLRKLAVEYTGVETAPTSVGTFFPSSSSGIYVQIPTDADQDMVEAGLTAVAALASRYDDDTPVELALSAPAPTVPVASTRVVSLVSGRAGEVTTAIAAVNGIPTLTLTGTGSQLVDAARTLSTDTLGLSGSNAENPSQQTKPRNTAKIRTLSSLGYGTVTVTGYGSNTQRLELAQDDFGQPIKSMQVHLEGSHTAFAETSGARLDVRANGALVGSTSLGDDSSFSLDLSVPAGRLTSVNDLDLTLTALAPDGSACTPASVPPAEVDVDTQASTVTVAAGTGEAKGFELFPQIFEGTLPIALRSTEGREASAAINAAALVATLQRAAGTPLDIQLMEPDAFLADDRSGLMIGALNSDSVALDAPLKLSATRLLDREDATFEVTSQDPYAALESVDRDNRLVLMLGSWAPGNKAAPGELARKVVDFVSNQGWASLDGDLVIADAANPAFSAASRSLAPHQEVVEEKSYAKWFVAVIAALLLLLGLQVVVAIRRDRQVARNDADGADDPDGPAYVEDEEEHDLDSLGDVDDLDVLEYTDNEARGPAVAAEEYEADEYDADEYDADEDDEDDELEEEPDVPADEPVEQPEEPDERPAKPPVKRKR